MRIYSAAVGAAGDTGVAGVSTFSSVAAPSWSSDPGKVNFEASEIVR